MNPVKSKSGGMEGEPVSDEFMFRCSRLRGPLGEWCALTHRISGEAHAMAMLIIFERKTPWAALIARHEGR